MEIIDAISAVGVLVLSAAVLWVYSRQRAVASFQLHLEFLAQLRSPEVEKAASAAAQAYFDKDIDEHTAGVDPVAWTPDGYATADAVTWCCS